MTKVGRFDAGVLIAGRYRVEREIGHGGMGQVFSALDQRLVRRVALKRCPLRHNGTDLQQQVVIEARVAAGAVHVNLARLYDVLTYDDCHVMVSEYIAGPSLEARLLLGALTIAEALSIAQQAARALACLHRQGIFHRDMKPGNVLIASEDDSRIVKVIDFGISKIVSGNLTVAAAGGRMSLTAEYASPEQCIECLAECQYGYAEEQLPAKVDARSDVWALGIILHEMLTGLHPFPNLPSEPIPRLRETAHCPAPSNRIVDPALRRLVERALAPYDERIASAEAFGAELARIQRLHERERRTRWWPWRSLGGLCLMCLSGATPQAPLEPVPPIEHVLASTRSSPQRMVLTVSPEPPIGSVTTIQHSCLSHDGWVKFRAAPNAKSKIVASARANLSGELSVRAVQYIQGAPQWIEAEHAPGEFGWIHRSVVDHISLRGKRHQCSCEDSALRCRSP